MPCICNEQRSDAWREARKDKITASLAAACLGLCPYTSRQKAFRLVLGIEEEKENEFMIHGRELESAATAVYEIETGHLTIPTGFWVSERFPWLGASPDALIGDDGLLEVKAPQKPTVALSIQHRVQCLVQLAVTGREFVDYFAWHQDGVFLKRVHRSGIDGLIAKLKAFYDAHILTGIEPSRKKAKRRKTVELVR